MSLYVYAAGPQSLSAKMVAEGLGATRLRRFDGKNFWDRSHRVEVRAGDSLICWGSHIGHLDGVRMLNASEDVGPATEQWGMFVRAGLLTPQILSMDPVNSIYGYRREGNENEWLPRSERGRGGADFLSPPAKPDYWVKRVKLDREMVVQSFTRKTLKAGIKVAEEGAHEWIRVPELGWRVDYSRGAEVGRDVKRCAHAAIRALRLNFGEVTIGHTTSVGLLVMKVNTAPGPEAVPEYVEMFRKWMEGSESDAVDTERTEGEIGGGEGLDPLPEQPPELALNPLPIPNYAFSEQLNSEPPVWDDEIAIGPPPGSISNTENWWRNYVVSGDRLEQALRGSNERITDSPRIRPVSGGE